MFREKLSNAPYMTSFDDVYIVPGRASLEPREVDVRTRFSSSIELLVPIASSPMDTVTGSELAIALALHGAIGVVHRNCSVDEQLEMVKRVKEFPPYPLRALYAEFNEPCSRVLESLRNEGLRDLPVIRDGRVVGYVSVTELLEHCRDNPLKPVGEIVAKSSAKPHRLFTLANIREARREVLEGRIDAVAITSSDGMYVGTLTLREALEEYTPLTDDDGRLRVAAAISPFDVARAKVLERYVDAFVSDVAHFHNVNVLKASRNLVRDISRDFIAGNVGTYEAVVDALTTIEVVHGFRVGIGGGSICITSEVCGAYVPTLWAVASVRDALEDHGAGSIPIIADGGIRTPGDAVKALAAGASSVMLGYVFAGTDEACAPLIAIGGRLYKPYRGMASRGAMARRYALDRYARISKRIAEGIEGLVPYRGPVSKVLREFVEGIKAGLGYAGASSIKELWEKARFGRTLKKYTPQDLIPRLR